MSDVQDGFARACRIDHEKYDESDEQTENAIFIIDRDGEELMVPASDDLIVEFDLDKKVMVMDLPQGLLDLN